MDTGQRGGVRGRVGRYSTARRRPEGVGGIIQQDDMSGWVQYSETAA